MWFMQTIYIKLSDWWWMTKATGTYSVILLAKFAVLLVSYQDISWRSTAFRNIHLTRPICKVIVLTNYPYKLSHRHHHISHWYVKQDMSFCNKAPSIVLFLPTSYTLLVLTVVIQEKYGYILRCKLYHSLPTLFCLTLTPGFYAYPWPPVTVHSVYSYFMLSEDTYYWPGITYAHKTAALNSLSFLLVFVPVETTHNIFMKILQWVISEPLTGVIFF
jgi:hypothetical protein